MHGFAAFYGTPSAQDTVNAVIDKALELGCTHSDTAEVYRSSFTLPPDETVWNEVQLGLALKHKPRHSFQLATKYLPSLHDNKADAASVSAALDASLKRLQMDFVDVYYMHRCVSKELVLEFVASVAELVKAGKVRSIGLSECPASWLEAALKVHHIDFIQMEWSALSRALEKNVVPVAAKNNVTIVAYSPLSRNLLADPVKPADGDWRLQNPRWSAENFANNQRIIEKLKKKAADMGATPAQLSLAWIYTKAQSLGATVLPIPGTTKATNLEANVNSLKFVPLDNDTVAMIDTLEESVKGDRYSDSMAGSTFDKLDSL